VVLRPGKKEFVDRAEPGTLVPVWAELSADLETPVSAYLKIAARFPSEHFLLESVEGAEKWARYSFVGFDPYLQLTAGPSGTILRRGRSVETLAPDADPLDTLAGILAGIRYRPAAGLPRLSGGAVGFVAYDYVRRLERLPGARRDDAFPEASFLFPSRLVIFDNVRHRIMIVAHAEIPPGGGAGEAYDRCAEAIAEVRRILAEPAPWSELPEAEEGGDPAFEVPREDFLARVARAKEYIRDGEIIQVVLSNRARVRTDRSPQEVYRVLRALNPSPYMYLLRAGDLAVVGSSPEVLVRLEGDEIRLRPIAGTRPRGATPEEDRRLEAELLSDPKELAEHVMLVDLGRNDVGRVARWGSVKVDELMVVERYSHVMHIVSNVVGRLGPGKTAFDVFRAAFPAGTVTGAPKIRAMEIIDELEPFRRGVYAGAVGYFDLQGNMDFCIAIRTILMQGQDAMIQAGAGIVADSDPPREWDEIAAKARVLFRAIGRGSGGGRA